MCLCCTAVTASYIYSHPCIFVELSCVIKHTNTCSDVILLHAGKYVYLDMAQAHMLMGVVLISVALIIVCVQRKCLHSNRKGMMMRKCMMTNLLVMFMPICHI